MAKQETYVQCRLQRGTEETTGWIPIRGAHVDYLVELIGDDGDLWTVVEVFTVEMSSDNLRLIQTLNRKSLPSVEPMK